MHLGVDKQKERRWFAVAGVREELMLMLGLASLLAYLEMVDVALRPHHQLTGWDGLTASAAGSAVPE